MIGTSSSTKTRPRIASSSTPLASTTRPHSRAVRGLHERIAQRDPRPAVAAAPAQQQPREHRDVVVRLDRRLAARAARARVRQRLAPRQPVGDHVEERAERASARRRRSATPSRRLLGDARRRRARAATVRRPRSASLVAVATTRRRSSGSRSCSDSALDEAGDGDGGAREHAALDRLGALLHPVEVQRVADGVGELVHALLEHGASRGRRARGRPRRSSSGACRPTCVHPLARVLGGQAAALGERVDHRVQAAGGGAGEQAARGVGDGDVGEPGDVDVEDGAGSTLRSASARTMPNADRSMPSTVRPASRAAPASCSTISRRTATTTTRVRCRPAALCDGAERLQVEHGLVHRHRDVVGRLRP